MSRSINYCISIFIFLILKHTPLSSQALPNLYDENRIIDIRIKFDRPDWDKALDSFKTQGKETRVLATVNIDGVPFKGAGVRYKGNSSYFGSRKKSLKKLPFNIKLPNGTTLKLSNINRDASFIREALTYDIIRTYMPAPRANFAKVYIDDKLFGLYCNTESIDEQFLEKMGEKNGYLIKCDPEWDTPSVSNCPPSEKAALVSMGKDTSCYLPFYEMGKNGKWQDFLDFLNALNTNTSPIEKHLNVDQALWMLAINNVLVNLDSYTGQLSHNYYLAHTSDGRFTPLIWDVNLSFGGFTFDGAAPTPLSIEQMQNLQPLLHIENPKRPLISQLLKVPFYKKIYAAHIRTILQDWFESGKYFERAQELSKRIDAAMVEDKNKHFSTDDVRKNLTSTITVGSEKVVGIKELMEKRTIFLKNHPFLTRPAPVFEEKNATISTQDDKTTVRIKASGAVRLWLVIRENTQKPFRYMPMFDDGNHNDSAANDGIFTIIFDKKTQFEYYFIAESEESASLLPEKGKMSYGQ